MQQNDHISSVNGVQASVIVRNDLRSTGFSVLYM